VYWLSSALAGPLRQLWASDCDMASGKISSCPCSTPSKMARATDSGAAFGNVETSGHIGVHRPGQHSIDAHAACGDEDAQRLRQV